MSTLSAIIKILMRFFFLFPGKRVFGAFLDEESSHLYDITEPFIFFLSLQLTSNRKYDVNGYKVYPNPTSDRLVLDLPEWVSGTQTEISDLDGSIVLNTRIIPDKNEIDISDLPKGVYIIRLLYENPILVTKFIKQ